VKRNSALLKDREVNCNGIGDEVRDSPKKEVVSHRQRSTPAEYSHASRPNSPLNSSFKMDRGGGLGSSKERNERQMGLHKEKQIALARAPQEKDKRSRKKLSGEDHILNWKIANQRGGKKEERESGGETSILENVLHSY